MDVGDWGIRGGCFGWRFQRLSSGRKEISQAGEGIDPEPTASDDEAQRGKPSLDRGHRFYTLRIRALRRCLKSLPNSSVIRLRIRPPTVTRSLRSILVQQSVNRETSSICLAAVV